MVHRLTESDIEDAALAWLEGLGWQVLNGPEIAPGEAAAERADYGQVILEDRLRTAITRINGDTMLSKLISGELSVKKAELFMEVRG